MTSFEGGPADGKKNWSTYFMRPPLEPLTHELRWFVRLAKTGQLTGTLETPKGIIGDLGAYVLHNALDYLVSDADAALERLGVAYQAYSEQGLIPNEPEPETKAPKVYSIPASATFRPCRACRVPITFIKTEAGASLPVIKAGTSHYLDCTDPKRFSKGAK